MNKYIFFIVLTMIFIIPSCKSKKVYSSAELKNIAKIDSISQAQKQVLIQDFKEDIDQNERYD